MNHAHIICAAFFLKEAQAGRRTRFIPASRPSTLSRHKSQGRLQNTLQHTRVRLPVALLPQAGYREAGSPPAAVRQGWQRPMRCCSVRPTRRRQTRKQELRRIWKSSGRKAFWPLEMFRPRLPMPDRRQTRQARGQGPAARQPMESSERRQWPAASCPQQPRRRANAASQQESPASRPWLSCFRLLALRPSAPAPGSSGSAGPAPA